ncbi:MAG: thiamine pyrophosphate-binding protein [Hyphomicrobiaceae bacterium]
MAKLNGAQIMARSLKEQGVEYMFGIVGFPVQEIAAQAQKAGIKYYGMRNEQTASYAAQAAGYMTGRPGACLTVSGPGVVHMLAGLANAQQNCWPMIGIGGASPTYQNGMGGFQEERQVQIASPFCKFAHAVEHTHRIPFYVEMAVRNSIYGRPGATYLDMPDDIIKGEVEEDKIAFPPKSAEPPRSMAMTENINKAIAALQSAEKPLVIVGKGMAWSRAEDEVRAFIERTKLPFLASPMGKGVMDDNHPLSVGAARSTALKEADVIFVMGARLNWIMHYGQQPRFNKNVRIIQLDIAHEAIGQNVPAEVALVGDGKAIVGQMNDALKNQQWFYAEGTPWRKQIADAAAKNAKQIQPMIDDNSAPTNYYRALKDIAAWAPKDAIIVGEGANTMDIGRTQLPNAAPRLRLDAGTYGTMGIGMGFRRRGMCGQSRPAGDLGDRRSRAGLLRHGDGNGLPLQHERQDRGAEQRRHRLGHGEVPGRSPQNPPRSLIYGARYDKMMEAFGGKGFYIEDPKDLKAALDQAMAHKGPALVNVKLHWAAGRSRRSLAGSRPEASAD